MVWRKDGLFDWVSIHEKLYGSTLLIYTIVETVIALILFIVLEVKYRIDRVKWRAEYTSKSIVNDSAKDVNQQILVDLRNKGNPLSPFKFLITLHSFGSINLFFFFPSFSLIVPRNQPFF